MRNKIKEEMVTKLIIKKESKIKIKKTSEKLINPNFNLNWSIFLKNITKILKN
jgi:hypothetical protein